MINLPGRVDCGVCPAAVPINKATVNRAARVNAILMREIIVATAARIKDELHQEEEPVLQRNRLP
jgi:hypothetical protein